MTASQGQQARRQRQIRKMISRIPSIQLGEQLGFYFLFNYFYNPLVIMNGEFIHIFVKTVNTYNSMVYYCEEVLDTANRR